MNAAMKIAVISLSGQGARIAAKLAAEFVEESAGSQLFLHQTVLELPEAKRFERIVELTAAIFSQFEGLVYVAPTGVVVRAIAPCLQHKTTDPAVVAVDVGGRWAVSLLGGHEAGANRLTLQVANLLGAEPVISTTTEAAKDLIIGVGCRRGTPAETIVGAIRDALALADCEPAGPCFTSNSGAAAGSCGSVKDTVGQANRGIPEFSLARVRLLASADIKADEPGLRQAAEELGLPLRLIAAEEIGRTALAFGHSQFVEEKVGIPAVAEPAALLAGRRTRLILPKTILRGVTVAVAREDFLPSA